MSITTPNMTRKIYVLRIGHRPGRDKRITTHVALVARAFGANGFLLADIADHALEAKIRKVCETWGGGWFHIETGVDPIRTVRNWKRGDGVVVHLTMYGIHVDDVINEIRECGRDLLVIVGASKVPPIYYELADYNVAVGHQPHSEVAALAIFLDRFYRGSELHFIFPDAKVRIEPSAKGKRVRVIGSAKESG